MRDTRTSRGGARGRRAGTGFAVLSAATLVALTATSATAAEPSGGSESEARLPAPTGAHSVGASTMHLADESRADMWNPDAEARELMVTMWYPTQTDDGPNAPYMTPKESAANVEQRGLDLPDNAFAEVATNAVADAPVLQTKQGSPLVVLSPGAGLSRAWTTALAEDLASHGFVVAGVDHAYEANGVEFPDGRVLDYIAGGEDRWPEATENRGKDIAFLLDELTGDDPAWEGAEEIDADRVGMAGQSAGGAAAAETMRVDERVDAGVNFDGPYYQPALDAGLDRPLSLVTSDLDPPPFHESQEQMWPKLSDWRQWLRLTDSGHVSSTDQGLIADQLGVRDQVPPDYWSDQFGDLPTERAVEISRDYTTGFFTHHLNGEEQEVITDPAGVHPEFHVVEQP